MITMQPVIGIDKLIEVLQEYPRSIQRQLVSAVNAGGAASETRAKQLSPVRTGRLRDGNKLLRAAGTHYIIQAILSNAVPYAPFVIWGTRKMRARDFWTPAIQYGRMVMSEKIMEIKL